MKNQIFAPGCDILFRYSCIMFLGHPKIWVLYLFYLGGSASGKEALGTNVLQSRGSFLNAMLHWKSRLGMWGFSHLAHIQFWAFAKSWTSCKQVQNDKKWLMQQQTTSTWSDKPLFKVIIIVDKFVFNVFCLHTLPFHANPRLVGFDILTTIRWSRAPNGKKRLYHQLLRKAFILPQIASPIYQNLCTDL